MYDKPPSPSTNRAVTPGLYTKHIDALDAVPASGVRHRPQEMSALQFTGTRAHRVHQPEGVRLRMFLHGFGWWLYFKSLAKRRPRERPHIRRSRLSEYLSTYQEFSRLRLLADLAGRQGLSGFMISQVLSVDFLQLYSETVEKV